MLLEVYSEADVLFTPWLEQALWASVSSHVCCPSRDCLALLTDPGQTLRPLLARRRLVLWIRVLLDWGGGNAVLLARMRDEEGCWLCSHEVHTKLGSSSTTTCWHHCITAGKLKLVKYMF